MDYCLMEKVYAGNLICRKWKRRGIPRISRGISLFWMVHNKRKTLFWMDYWLEDHPLRQDVLHDLTLVESYRTVTTIN